MYSLEEVIENDGKEFIGIRIKVGNQTVAELRGGLSILITTQHAAYEGKSNALGMRDAFLSGIATALNHCTLTGSIPIVTDGRTI